jgi:hypothetical protein
MGFLLLVLTNIQTIVSLRFKLILNFYLYWLGQSGSNPLFTPLIPKLSKRNVLLIITDMVGINYISSSRHIY